METKKTRSSRDIVKKVVKRRVSKSPVKKVKSPVKKATGALKKKITKRPKTRGGENEDQEQKQEQELEGGARKRIHKRMCARKLSPYNLFVKQRMCEMRKTNKAPVVELMKSIAIEWKAKK